MISLEKGEKDNSVSVVHGLCVSIWGEDKPCHRGMSSSR